MVFWCFMFNLIKFICYLSYLLIFKTCEIMIAQFDNIPTFKITTASYFKFLNNSLNYFSQNIKWLFETIYIFSDKKKKEISINTNINILISKMQLLTIENQTITWKLFQRDISKPSRNFTSSNKKNWEMVLLEL